MRCSATESKRFAILVISVMSLMLVVGCTTVDNTSTNNKVIWGYVTWYDDTNGETNPDSFVDILVFPPSDIEFFISSIKITEEYGRKYIEKNDVLPSYRFENTDTEGKYQFELENTTAVICFGAKTPNEANFERFYPERCYRFFVVERGTHTVINFGGDMHRVATCENIVCDEVEL